MVPCRHAGRDLPSGLGVRQGTLDAAEQPRPQGHDVLVSDPFDGRTFDDYSPAMSHAWEEIGQVELMRRAPAGVRKLPDGFVAIGFSLGCLLAGYVATRRQVSAVVMIARAIPVSVLGEKWPAGVPAQTHSSIDDPRRRGGGASIEVFDYPGSGHLFTDPTLPDECDPASMQLLWERVLPFLDGLGSAVS